jgi:hypothetical protein
MSTGFGGTVERRYRTVVMIGTITTLQTRTSRAHWTICVRLAATRCLPLLGSGQEMTCFLGPAMSYT